MATISIFAQNNEKKDDYVNFNEHGALVSFQKTDLDGTVFEIGECLNPSVGSFFPLRITRTNGDVFDGEIKIYAENLEGFYRAISDNHFDEWWRLPKYMQRNDLIQRKRLYSNEPVTITTHDGWVYDLTNDMLEQPLGNNGDYYVFDIEFPNDDSGYLIYDYENASGYCCGFQFTYPEGIVKISCFNYGFHGLRIEYLDGSIYEGKVLNAYTYSKHQYGEPDWSFWNTISSLTQLEYEDGVLTDKNGKCKAYTKGKEDPLETARAQQSKDKAREKKIREEEERKKAIAALEKQYGKKYTDALLKGDLILGMPEDLFLLGVEGKAFKRIYDVKLDYKSTSYSCYKIYGWEIGGEYLITNRAYLGKAYFNNGKLTSMDFK